ncbi:serine hydrolase domain-containing protein [Planctomycetota bacterium]
MKPATRKALYVTGIIGATVLALLAGILLQAATVGVGFVAEVVGSGVFVSGRDSVAVLQQDLGVAPLRLANVEVNRAQKTVTVSLFGLLRKQAIYRPGLGCTLANGVPLEALRAQSVAMPRPAPHDPNEAPWPVGNRDAMPEVPPGVDAAVLNAALEGAFAEPNARTPRLTRAVVVAFRGRIIAERYRPGFPQDMPLIGWSMTKSVLNALVGILVREGKLKVEDAAPIDAWHREGDPRAEITLDQLLRMSSGLEFDESYVNPFSDVNHMLWKVADAAAFAARKPLRHPPDTVWAYSSGTSNVIAQIIRQAVGDDAEHLRFPRRALFNRIGMRSAVMSPDAGGTFVGSSLMFATARDWARFGLLYVQDGVWKGERILPVGWVKYSTTPTPGAPLGRYGAHFWLNAGDPKLPEARRFPSLPRDLFYASGYQGQRLVIVPSRHLVVVRLGMTHQGGCGLERLVAGIISALPR